MTCGNGIEVPVALAPGRPGAYTISGELCSTAAERHRGAMVQLLIPGATYSHGYWDFGSEEDHQLSKQAAGLDAGQVVRWTSWHRWTAICLCHSRVGPFWRPVNGAKPG